MTEFSELVEHSFSLASLQDLNPRDPAEMAQRIIGTYTLNAHGLQTCTTYIRQHFPMGTPGHEAACSEIDVAARKNHATIADQLGKRLIGVSSLRTRDKPITSHDFRQPAQVAGIANIHAENSLFRLAPPGRARVNLLRIYERPPHPNKPAVRDTAYYDATVVNGHAQPLIAIRLLTPGDRLRLGLTRFQDAVREETKSLGLLH